jgi:glycosyltransferase involved in cell wall biosynthesis
MKIEFCLPAYNEEQILFGNTVKVLDFCQAQNWDFDWQIIILVNGSSDRTAAIAQELARLRPAEIKIKIFPSNGKGRVIREYYGQSQADILIYMDVDLAVALSDLPALLDGILKDDYDLVMGSRLLHGAKIKRSLIRELSSQSYNLLSRLVLRHSFSDLQCGFKAITKSGFAKIRPYLQENFWFFDTEFIAFAKYSGLKIKEIPVSWEENRYQERKSHIRLLNDSISFIVQLIRLRRRLWRLARTQ